MSNFRKSFPEVKERFIAVAGKDEYTLQQVKDQVEEAMRRKRHVPHHAENDFEISPTPIFSARSGISSPARWCCSPASSVPSVCWWAGSAS
jgi:hypothetical protein